MSITVLTAYDFNTARALTEAGVDYILVGDSLAMVALGYENTTLVTVDEMLSATAAVARGVKACNERHVILSEAKDPHAATHKGSFALRAQDDHKPVIIADLPYKAIFTGHCDEAIHYPISEIVTTCKHFIAAGANIIKIENARPLSLEIIRALRAEGIRVMGHIGYTPQDIDLFSKSKIIRDADALLHDAKALEAAGVESMVLEMVPLEIARDITIALNPRTTEISQSRKSCVPTIGIGSGPHTTGQVLVTDDMLGRYNLINPKFLRRYGQQYNETVSAVQSYIKDVKAGEFPQLQESYT